MSRPPLDGTVLVTGASSGIGLELSKLFAARAKRLVLVARRKDRLDALADELGRAHPSLEVRAEACDLGAPDEAARLVERLAGEGVDIDVLVNNAGVAPEERRDLLDATPESYDRVMGINLRGPYFLTQAVARQMLQQESADPTVRGVIVNVSSISATTVSINRGEYCLSKAGVSMATRLWAARLAPEGILAYEVRPGVIATDMTAGVKERYDALFAQGLSPMPRWGQPSDVGGAVAALASGAMPYSTGDVIHVDGGMHLPRL